MGYALRGELSFCRCRIVPTRSTPLGPLVSFRVDRRRGNGLQLFASPKLPSTPLESVSNRVGASKRPVTEFPFYYLGMVWFGSMSVNDTPSPSRSTSTPEVTPDEEVGATKTPDLSRDQIFHLLQNQRRREVLRYLRDADEERVRMRDIAEAIAAAEHETSVEALSSKQRQRVYVPLYQNHLPKLDADGVLNYDQDRGIVERAPAAEQLERHLWPSETPSDDVDDTTDVSGEPTRPPWFLGAAALGGTVFGGATFDVSLLAVVPDVAVSAFAVGLLVAVSVWQYATATPAPGDQRKHD